MAILSLTTSVLDFVNAAVSEVNAGDEATALNLLRAARDVLNRELGDEAAEPTEASKEETEQSVLKNMTMDQLINSISQLFSEARNAQAVGAFTMALDRLAELSGLIIREIGADVDAEALPSETEEVPGEKGHCRPADSAEKTG